MACSVSGCGNAPAVVASDGAYDVATYAGALYVTQYQASVVTFQPTAGATPTTLWAAGYTPVATDIAVDASGVYWGG